uniref:Integrin subunit alpha D n=1 Tax=Cavia porcellus TaxID=10141 RepID=A0A286Y204_CAVPO
DCLRFRCDVPSFGIREELDFILKGNLSFGWVSQMETVLEEFEVYNPISLMIGSCVGGLLLLALITASLYKFGFFKRQYKEMLTGKPENPATFREEDVSCEAPDLPMS